MSERRIAAVVADIEGTTTAIAFVHRGRRSPSRMRGSMPSWTGTRPTPRVAAALAQAAADPDAKGDVRAALHRWIAIDRKFGPLKTLQGLIWAEGYRAGVLHSHLYDDVAPRCAPGTRPG